MANPFAGTKFYAKLGNRFTRPLWSRLRPPQGFGVITTVGAKTGTPRPWSVRAIRRGSRVYVVCMLGEKAAWLKNVRANPRVALRLRDGSFQGIARELADGRERDEAIDVYVGTVVPNDWMDYLVYHWRIPTRSRIADAHRRWFDDGVPLVVELIEDADG